MVQKFLIHTMFNNQFPFILLICISCGTFSVVPGKNVTASSGPYKSMLIKVQHCEKTTYPIEKDPPLDMNLEVYNSSAKSFLFRGNFTVFRDNKQVKVKTKSFVWSNGKWKMAYLMNNLGCHSVLLHLFTLAVGLKYDRETCSFYKGKYYFENIDIDTIQHIWTSKMEYGRILWTSEATTLSTSFFCWEFETLVEPL